MGREDRRYDDRGHARDRRQHESRRRYDSPPPLPRRDTPRHIDRPDERHRRHHPSNPRPHSPAPRQTHSPARPRDPSPRRAPRTQPRHTPSKRQRSPESTLRHRTSREGPQQPVVVSARLRRQVAAYEVSEALASHRIFNHCTAMKHAAPPPAHPPLATVVLLEGALSRPEAVMTGQHVVHDRAASFARCLKALRTPPDGMTLLQSEHGEFLVPQCMLR